MFNLKKTLFLILTGLLVLLFSCTQDNNQESSNVNAMVMLLPQENEVIVDVYQLLAPQKVGEYTERIKAAIQKNPEWWQSFVKKSKPGEPMPYDARIGLTESEYNEYLDLVNKWEATISGKAKISIERTESTITLIGSSEIINFKNIVIDMKNNTIATDYGVLNDYSEISASEKQLPSPWNGHQWKMEKQKGNFGTIVKLAIGEFVDSEKKIIYYTVKDINANQKDSYFYILAFN